MEQCHFRISKAVNAEPPSFHTEHMSNGCRLSVGEACALRHERNGESFRALNLDAMLAPAHHDIRCNRPVGPPNPPAMHGPFLRWPFRIKELELFII